MSSYSAVPFSMYDETFARLSRDAQVLELFIRTSPSRNSEGLSRLKWGAIDDATGLDQESARNALDELKEAGRPFMFDARAGVILDFNALRTQPIGSLKPEATWEGIDKAERRLKGAISRLQALPKTPLLKHLLLLADEYSPQLGMAMREAFPDIEEPLSEAPSEAASHGPSLAPSEASTEGASREESSSEEASRVATDPIELLRRNLDAKVVEVVG